MNTRTMFTSLSDLLIQVLSGRDSGITKRLRAIEEDIEENTAGIQSNTNGLTDIKVFLGAVDGPPGTVSGAQIAETLAKIHVLASAIGSFNP